MISIITQWTTRYKDLYYYDVVDYLMDCFVAKAPEIKRHFLFKRGLFCLVLGFTGFNLGSSFDNYHD
jgi:hypothetical protein